MHWIISCHSFELLIVPICCLNNIIITKYEFSFCLRLRSIFLWFVCWLVRSCTSFAHLSSDYHLTAFTLNRIPILFSYERMCVCWTFFFSFILFASFFLPIRSSLPSLNSHKLLYFIWLSDDMTIDWRRKFSGEVSLFLWVFTVHVCDTHMDVLEFLLSVSRGRSMSSYGMRWYSSFGVYRFFFFLSFFLFGSLLPFVTTDDTKIW